MYISKIEPIKWLTSIKVQSLSR